MHIAHPRLGLDFLCVADLGTWVVSKIVVSYWPESVRNPVLRDSVNSGLLPHTPFHKEKRERFTPIGAFYANFMDRLAWEDSTLRDVVDYYRETKIGGGGGGKLHSWHFDILSNAVQKQIREGGRLSHHAWSWDEWKNNFGLRMQT